MDQKSPEAFRTISEVADWLGVPTHVLRFWESRFSQVKPVKRAGGRRYYRPADMELLGGIRKLLHEDGMTIRGVQKLLREQGVRHVSALSPALDIGPDEKDVSPGNVVDLTNRRGARAEPRPVDDAETFDEAPAGEPQDRRFPFDDEPVAAPESAHEGHPDLALAGETGPVEAVAEVSEPEQAETALDAATDAQPDAASETQSPATDAQPDALDVTDPLPSPEAMDFLAHDATPDSFEPEGDSAPDAPLAPAAATLTEPDDSISSPEALTFAAHDAEPELTEAVAQPEAAPEPAPEAVAELEPARPALVMPDIDADPDDDDREAGPLPAADLRALRAARADVHIAALQALADRLEEITMRIGHGADRAGSL